MTTTLIILAVAFFTLPAIALGWALCQWHLGRKAKKAQPVKDYPFKNMFQNFTKIEDEIKACETESDLKKARLSLMAFAGLYTDSGSFVSELDEMLTDKQEEIYNKELIESMIGI